MRHFEKNELSKNAEFEQLSVAEIDLQIATLVARKQQLINDSSNRSSDVVDSGQPHQKSAKKSAELFECRKQGCRNVVIIGGGGQLGRLFVSLFSRSEYLVECIEPENWPTAETHFRRAALVLVAVPIEVTLTVIKQLGNLPKDCVLADITSIKAAPLEAMLAAHSGAVVGLHPMFGPDVADFSGQTIVLCHGRGADKYQWVREQLEIWGANIQAVSAEEHDQTMAIVQVLRHFSTVAYGAHLAQENIALEQILKLSSPIYRLELVMVGRLFAQNPDLYTEIIFANPVNIAMMRRFIQRFSELLLLVEKQDKKAFKTEFAAIAGWFGDFAKTFLDESSQLLTATHKQTN